ncbi:hypothetical protein NG774_05610 [Aliarcobacter cryaerophilus]|uniref:hypothetical protein n=1 Tax=Aliarcobacter cryaerophilus TaxID=28198 RepID=UPI003DA63C38
MSESTPAECPDVNRLAVRIVPAYALPRNSVKDVLGVSKPTAIKIVKELEKREYITSLKPQGPISIKFNSHFASEVIPEIFPKV